MFDVIARSAPQNLLRIVHLFYANMKGVLQFDVSSSEAFNTGTGVMRGYKFGLLFAVILKHTFGTLADVVSIHTRLN